MNDAVTPELMNASALIISVYRHIGLHEMAIDDGTRLPRAFGRYDGPQGGSKRAWLSCETLCGAAR